MTSPATVTRTKTPNWADVDIQTTVPNTDVTRMSVDADGAAHIMSLLTDLYSDAELAVLREYTSNAIDSHRAAGTTDPILVHMPVALSPNFIVEDFGTGMSADDIRRIYSSYGASTKRNDMTQIGAFGLGCKSALTLTQQFTLVSVKDGKRTVAHILRGADGVGAVSIMSEKETEARNGVKVTIPIPDVNSFTSKANQFFHTWKSDDVLVNGEKPKTIFDQDHITFAPSNSAFSEAHLMRPIEYYDRPANYERGLFVMLGGIRYRIDLTNTAVRQAVSGGVHEVAASTMIVLDIPIGSVDLVPSREAIRYSPRTIENIKKFTVTLFDDIFAQILLDIDIAQNRREAVARRDSWLELRSRSLNDREFKWKGEVIPRNFILKNLMSITLHQSNRGGGWRAKINEYTDPDAERNIILKTVLDGNIYYTVDKREKEKTRGYVGMFLGYLRQNHLTVSYNKNLLHLTTEPTDPWFKEFAIRVDMDTMLADAKKWNAAQRALNPRTPGAAKADFEYPAMVIDVSGGISFEKVKVGSFKKGVQFTEIGQSHDTVIDVTVTKFIKERGYATYRMEKLQFDWVRRLLSGAYPQGATIVFLEGSRTKEALFNRSEVPIENAAARIRQAAADLVQNTGAQAVAVARMRAYAYSMYVDPEDFKVLTPVTAKIDDPELVSLVNLLGTDSKISHEEVDFYRRIAGIPSAGNVIQDAENTLQKRITAVLDKYPLLGVVSSEYHRYQKGDLVGDLVNYLNYTYGKANN